MGSRKAGEYAGDLAQPIRPARKRGVLESVTDGLPAGKRLVRGEVERVLEEMGRKTLLLFEYFRIDPASELAWVQLSIELAVKHVPGFSMEVQPRRGRPRNARFYLDVLKIQEEEATAGRPASAAAACRILAGRNVKAPGKEPNEIRLAGRKKTLQNQFATARRKIEG